MDAGSVVGWLRCSEAKSSGETRVALLLADARGRALGFCCARKRRSDSRLRGAESVDLSLRRACIESACRSASPKPAVLMGLAGELPEEPVGGTGSPPIPCCRVFLEEDRISVIDGGLAVTAPRMHWSAGEPARDSDAWNLHVRVTERYAPMEPLRRAGAGLREAFAHPGLEALGEGADLAVSFLFPPVDRDQRGSGAAQRRASRQPAEHPRADVPLIERLRDVLAAPPAAALLGAGLPLGWPADDLMPFQVDGVRALLANDRLLLADDMGLGKTVQAAVALRLLVARGRARRCLIVAPAGVLGQWRVELAKWAPEVSAIIVRGSPSERDAFWQAEKTVSLVSYETLRSDVARRGPPTSAEWDLVVADEAQRIKNRDADASAAVKRLARARSWAITGTPLENREDELASILEYVDHDRSGFPKRYWPGQELRTRHGELQLRRKKSEVLRDLPPKRTTKLAIELTANQRLRYKDAETKGIVHLSRLGNDLKITHVLALITKLKQICNTDPVTGESSKMDDICLRVEQLVNEGHKALVFSQYVHGSSGVHALARRLESFNPITITGDTDLQERDESVRDFNDRENSHKILVLSLRAGGLGLNLQTASYAFHLDRWWNPAAESQAEDRMHRYGQTGKVNVVKYCCLNTIEDRIDKILQEKASLFDELINDVSLDLDRHNMTETNASLDLGAQLTREELYGVFGLTA